jgi:hypothetical protein
LRGCVGTAATHVRSLERVCGYGCGCGCEGERVRVAVVVVVVVHVWSLESG